MKTAHHPLAVCVLPAADLRPSEAAQRTARVLAWIERVEQEQAHLCRELNTRQKETRAAACNRSAEGYLS